MVANRRRGIEQGRHSSKLRVLQQWLPTQDPKINQRKLDYNEDDCRAMRVLLDVMLG
jgi:predicted RecB family nuclease